MEMNFELRTASMQQAAFLFSSAFREKISVTATATATATDSSPPPPPPKEEEEEENEETKPKDGVASADAAATVAVEDVVPTTTAVTTKVVAVAAVLLGPLLGPAIPADEALEVSKPMGFEVPADLEYVGLELTVPVGFRRLRWALLSTESQFISEAFYREEAKYEDITRGQWNRYDEYIGSPSLADNSNNSNIPLPDSVKEEDFIGAEKVGSYLMPKSMFVGAIRCSETLYIHAYNEYCFTLKKKALTPEVPFGSTFCAWTQFTVVNTGQNSCRLQFSVEPEFPNGPPPFMVSGQIRAGMRAGVRELFVLLAKTIVKYADEYP